MNSESIVIVGAGWSGLAAAVKLTQQGHHVTLFESAKQVGGRARTVKFNDFDVDNGQHILIGAYTECLDLMRLVGINIDTALKRLPLRLKVVDKTPLILKAPALPAPLHLLYALITAKGLTLKDKIAAIRFGLHLQKNNYQLINDISVNELFTITKQTNTLIRQLWEPLCLATLNTPIKEASANIFMQVYQDAFTNKRQDADILLPTTDLSRLFPNAAIDYITKHGGKVYLKSRVEDISISDDQITGITAKTESEPALKIKTSKLIIATAPQNLKKLISQNDKLKYVTEKIEKFKYQPITTVYLQYPEKTTLTQPMTGMSNSISQWFFDRGTICQQNGLISVVISASGQHMNMDDDTLTQAVKDEITVLFTHKHELIDSFVIREKRATFACNVNINKIRPQNTTSIKGLFIAGDYTNTQYPATLEGAVRSGITASQLILK